jgi:hypothetical protein
MQAVPAAVAEVLMMMMMFFEAPQSPVLMHQM